jgi:NADH:ubiquinone oxidoreductase subunit F (NADH-binding)
VTVLPAVASLPAKQGGLPVRVHPGERLLSPDPGLPVPRVGLDELVRLTEGCGLRGRGGAGFPFATKLSATAASRGRPVVVVNAAEGEPASAKDSVLMLTRPDLVIDGALATAAALRACVVHVVVPADRPGVVAAARSALDARAQRPSRRRDRVRLQLHVAPPRFVAGQATAVLELLAGRPGVPVTAWRPAAVEGLGGHPTLLSNAETWAQVATALQLGAATFGKVGEADEPGTVLLTVAGDTAAATVVEVATGTPLDDVLVGTGHDPMGPVLTGGYHGRWLAPGAATGLPISRRWLAGAGGTLGAGVLLPLPVGSCPVVRTAAVAAYLAGESARRCGPCLNGLPALAAELAALARAGRATAARVPHLIGRVSGRGASAHPDGTARLVASLLETFPDEVAAHELGRCDAGGARRWPS